MPHTVSLPESSEPRFTRTKPCQFALHAHEKRMPATLAPIKWKAGVVESPIGPYLQIIELAEIVHVQRQQVGQDLLRSARDNFDMGERRLCAVHQGKGGAAGNPPLECDLNTLLSAMTSSINGLVAQ